MCLCVCVCVYVCVCVCSCSILLERRKFRTLGLNIPYDFNDTDFSVSDDLLKSYLDSYEQTPWDALKYLISEANYGGRVTDELDRRVLASYLNKFYCEDALTQQNYLLSPLPTYYIPDNGPLQSFKVGVARVGLHGLPLHIHTRARLSLAVVRGEAAFHALYCGCGHVCIRMHVCVCVMCTAPMQDYITTLPATDRPEAFGQHANAEISYLIEDSRVLLDSLTALQPRTGGASAAAGGQSREDLVMTIATDLLEQVCDTHTHTHTHRHTCIVLYTLVYTHTQTRRHTQDR